MRSLTSAGWRCIFPQCPGGNATERERRHGYEGHPSWRGHTWDGCVPKKLGAGGSEKEALRRARIPRAKARGIRAHLERGAQEVGSLDDIPPKKRRLMVHASREALSTNG